MASWKTLFFLQFFTKEDVFVNVGLGFLWLQPLYSNLRPQHQSTKNKQGAAEMQIHLWFLKILLLLLSRKPFIHQGKNKDRLHPHNLRSYSVSRDYYLCSMYLLRVLGNCLISLMTNANLVHLKRNHIT